MTAAIIDSAEGEGHELRHEAIKNSRTYHGQQSKAIDALVSDIDNLPAEVYEQIGGRTVLEIVEKVADRKPVSMDPAEARDIAGDLAEKNAEIAAKFMTSVCGMIEGPYNPYAGENPSHIIRPDIAIPGFAANTSRP